MTFSTRPINLDCTAIDDAAGNTVAYVTPHGWVDWLLREPGQPGTHLESIDKETHLGNVRGMKFNLHMQNPHVGVMRRMDVQASDQGRRLTITAHATTPDGSLRSECRAELVVSTVTGR